MKPFIFYQSVNAGNNYQSDNFLMTGEYIWRVIIRAYKFSGFGKIGNIRIHIYSIFFKK